MRDDSASWASIVPYLDQALELELHELTVWLDQLAVTQAELANSLRELLGERDALANRYYGLASYAAMAARRAIVQGRLAAAEGNFTQARALFDAVLSAGKNGVCRDEVLLNKAEMELRAGDATAALAIARSALDGAVSRQGGLRARELLAEE